MQKADPLKKAEQVPQPRHWFEPMADHLGTAYLRYSFTKNTVREVDFVIDALDLAPGARVLDVGCGPGRHCLELARRGFVAVGVDISSTFVEAARSLASAEDLNNATFLVADARSLSFDNDFDGVFGMCQGAFGLQSGPAAGPDLGNLDADTAILAGMHRAVRPGSRVGVAAFSSYFQVRHLEGGTDGSFDPLTATHHEVTTIRSEAGAAAPADLWTTCFTPRELVLLARSVGLEPLDVWSVTSGERYEPRAAELDEPEFFLTARKRVPRA